jgi:hypothetical protein
MVGANAVSIPWKERNELAAESLVTFFDFDEGRVAVKPWRCMFAGRSAAAS